MITFIVPFSIVFANQTTQGIKSTVNSTVAPVSFFLTNQTYFGENTKIGSFVDLSGNKLTGQISLQGENATLFKVVNGDLFVNGTIPVSSVYWYDLEVLTELNGVQQTRTFRLVKDDFLRNKVIAHRGAWKIKALPQNSIASLKEAEAIGCYGSETDIWISSDSVLIINHDTSYGGYVIEDTKSSVLATVKLTNNEQLPTLQMYVEELMKQNKTKLIIEIKTSNKGLARSLASAQILVDKIHEMKVDAWVEYIAFDYDVLKKIHLCDPVAKIAYLNGDKTPAQASADKMNGLDYQTTVYKANLTYSTDAKNAGLTLNVWTIDASDDMDYYIGKNFDFITTNQPQLLFDRVKAILGTPVFGGGRGITADPYLIGTAQHMMSMNYADYVNPVYFKLIADIDLGTIAWKPVSPTGPYKRINFDGNGHIIKNVTVNGTTGYNSLFGVLCGSCKNLGVIHATITSTASGVGIIAGYAGMLTPTDASYTGLIENCYTTGTVNGTNAVGGITGNIGKPKNGSVSGVRNCYSTADVTATNATTSSRVGGITGICYAGGILENSYSTGKVTSLGSMGAGGITGYSEADIKGCIAMNDSVISKVSGNTGRIAAQMTSVNGIQAQGINCLSTEKVVVNNAGIIKSEQDYIAGPITIADSQYDGNTGTHAFLSSYSNLETGLGWNFTGTDPVWNVTFDSGYPIFNWLFNRGDYALIDGHSSLTSVKSIQTNPFAGIKITHHTIHLNSTDRIQSVSVYNTLGNQLVNLTTPGYESTIQLPGNGIYIIKVLINNSVVNNKISLN